MTHWLDIVGVSEAGVASLPAEPLALLEGAEVVIGVGRRLDGFKTSGKEIIQWDGNLTEMVEKIMQAQHKRTVLLASGDPNWFGIAATLSRRLSAEEFAIHPVPSSFQLAAARLHWPLQEVKTLSLHGRPVENLHPHILPQNRILALTGDRTTLPAIADLLAARGYGQSRLTVLETLGGADEKIRAFPAAAAREVEIGDFYVLAIDCVADADAPLLPPVSGLPDQAFVSDGQLTKREVRAATLAKLAPYPEALLWDVGAGCGSVGIEWMRAARGARAIAFERDEKRCGMIAANKAALGVPTLEIVEGEAPETLAWTLGPRRGLSRRRCRRRGALRRLLAMPSDRAVGWSPMQ